MKARIVNTLALWGRNIGDPGWYTRLWLYLADRWDLWEDAFPPQDVEVTITVTRDEASALAYYWQENDDLGDVYLTTGIDLLDILGRLAQASLDPADEVWGEAH